MNNFITDQIFTKWFTAVTDCDPQLKFFIDSRVSNDQIGPTYQQISNTLFRSDNPYDEYIYNNKQIECPNIEYNARISDKTTKIIVEKLGYSPKLGIEVGSFIGSSAIILAKQLLSPGGILLCVDTWCGDINMWLLDVFSPIMNKPDGNPKIFDLFMNNMITNQLTDIVIPIRISSIAGARMLKVLNYDIDFVYIDSAHEVGETFLELMLYHELLKTNGILFGDDYHLFPAIKHDVDLFCSYFGYELLFTGDNDTWLIQKI